MAGVPAGKQGMADSETEDTAETGSMVESENRAESGCRAETEAAAAGWADSVPKVLAVLLLLAVVAVQTEVQAAEAGRWVWLGETESESAVGSLSEAWSYQCQELSASDNSDTATPGPENRKI